MIPTITMNAFNLVRQEADRNTNGDEEQREDENPRAPMEFLHLHLPTLSACWLIPTPNHEVRTKGFSASASQLRSCINKISLLVRLTRVFFWIFSIRSAKKISDYYISNKLV